MEEDMEMDELTAAPPLRKTVASANRHLTPTTVLLLLILAVTTTQWATLFSRCSPPSPPSAPHPHPPPATIPSIIPPAPPATAGFILPPSPDASKLGGPHVQRLWAAAHPVIEKIEKHDFLQQLLDGTLPLASFQFYIRQDALYLKRFGKGLSDLWTRSPSSAFNASVDLLTFARSTVLVESGMHAQWMAAWRGNHSGEEELSQPEAPVTELYTSFLLRTAEEASWAEALAAFTPCFWIYLHIGWRLLTERAKRQLPSPRWEYDGWITAYGKPGFDKHVISMLGIVERAAEAASEEERMLMEQAFTKACKMEWMFWKMGLDREGWPV